MVPYPSFHCSYIHCTPVFIVCTNFPNSFFTAKGASCLAPFSTISSTLIHFNKFKKLYIVSLFINVFLLLLVYSSHHKVARVFLEKILKFSFLSKNRVSNKKRLLYVALGMRHHYDCCPLLLLRSLI